MDRLTSRALALLWLGPLLLFAACGATGRGTTEAFDANTPRTVFVLAPAPGLVTGEEAELVRRKLMRALREKGYGVTSAADAMLLPEIEVWTSQARSDGSSREKVTLSARLIDRADQLLWEDRGYAHEEPDDDEDGDLLDGLLDAAISNATARWSKRRSRLAQEAVYDLLRSLPDAPGR